MSGLAKLTGGLGVLSGSVEASCMACEAQRPGARDARVATATLTPDSLQGMLSDVSGVSKLICPLLSSYPLAR